MYSLLVVEVSVPKDSSNFRLTTLRSVNGRRVACCVQHSVLRLLWPKEYCLLGRSGGISVLGGWVREAGIDRVRGTGCYRLYS